MKAVILGAGRMGRRHVAVARLAGLEVTGVMDVMADSLRAARTECDLVESQLFESVDAALSTRPDVVIVASTATSHSELVIASAKRGARFILCEKPLATSLKDCDAMAAACAASGAALAVNHQMRYMPQYEEPKRITSEPDFGGLSSVSFVAGNFGMAMNGTHYFEAVRYLFDDEPASVTARFDAGLVPNPRGAQFEDRSGTLSIVTKSGKRAYLDISADHGHGMLAIYAGPLGQLVIDELAGWGRLRTRKTEDQALPSTRYGTPPNERVFDLPPAEVIEPSRRVLADLLEGRGFPEAGAGRLAVQTLIAAYLSDERGSVPVRLDEAEKARDRRFPWS